MFSCHALRPLDCPYLFTGIFSVEIVKQISERGKIIVALCTVYTVIDCDIAHISFNEKDFCIVSSRLSDSHAPSGTYP